MLRHVAFQFDQPFHPLAQARYAVVLAAGDKDQPARPNAFERFGDAQLVLATMPAAQNQRRVEVFSLRLRRDMMTGRERAEPGAKSLDERKIGGKAVGQPKAGLSAEEKHAAPCGRQFESARFERVKKRSGRTWFHRGYWYPREGWTADLPPVVLGAFSDLM